MVLSWIDLSISNFAKPFSLSLDTGDFLFLAGETRADKLMRALAGFLPGESNSSDAIRVDGQRLKKNERFDSVLLPKNFAQALPPHRTIGQFALDISPNRNKKSLETYALKYGIERHVLYSKPAKVPARMLQKISLWCTSLFTSAAVFIEEPDGGFCEECHPFDFLQGLLANSITNCIIYCASAKEDILQKARAMQLCRARIAIFCADRLVEEGEAIRVLREPVHNYTKDWIDNGSFEPKRNNSLWSYCQQNCEEQNNCQARQAMSSVMWDCSNEGLHKVICKGFL
jgi:ABC-type dipeptide/oligopeptide/nickel transport system ATPase subunit